MILTKKLQKRIILLVLERYKIEEKIFGQIWTRDLTNHLDILILLKFNKI
ncbi:MAG: hypothetical protein BAJALOKI1v1_2420011 [Promethearchaeota archaeon]|nr:MAG: hypothetical protein BAJALOKI1v1_2420011 [Candidatus Lokiarchaeota archaeon]